MKILYLLQDLPYPLTNGVRVKVFNLISYMTKSHDCHILSFGDEDLHARALAFQKKVSGVRVLNLYPLCSGLKLQLGRLAYFVRGEPVFLARWHDDAFATTVRQILKTTQYDVIHLDALAMAPYVHLCWSIPTVISTTDAVSLAESRRAQTMRISIPKIYRLLTSWSIARFEHKMLPLFTRVHVVSKPDRDYLRARIPTAHIECIEHVVPDEVLQYSGGNPRALSCNKRILFTGSLRRGGIAVGLLTFLSLVYPIIWKVCSDVEMIILGGIPPVNVRRQIENTPGVRIVEWVDDYYAEIMKAQVIVCPDVTGTGIKTRVLYALALGKPLVASPAALEGIDVQDGVHCFEHKMGKGFAESVLALLRDEDLRHKIGQNAKKLIAEQYNMRMSGAKWTKLYESAVAAYA
jgi:glycosyltransferase involved in cell wall biosynthesis